MKTVPNWSYTNPFSLSREFLFKSPELKFYIRCTIPSYLTVKTPTKSSCKKLFHKHIRGYRHSFNGQELDNEVAGEGNSYTAEFWQYDPRLGRRFNIDPKPIPSISNYACFANNPIWCIDVLGDSSVVNNKGSVLHYDPKDKDLRIFQMNEDNSLKEIGQFGQKIDITEIYSNILNENRETAKKLDGPLDFKKMVETGADWDYKSNKKTLFGIVWEFDKDAPEASKTKLTFTKHITFDDVSDLGNHHFGYVGKFVGTSGLSDFILHEGAAWAELQKDNGFILGIIGYLNPQRAMMPSHGDEDDDYYWIDRGIRFANFQINK